MLQKRLMVHQIEYKDGSNAVSCYLPEDSGPDKNAAAEPSCHGNLPAALKKDMADLLFQLGKLFPNLYDWPSQRPFEPQSLPGYLPGWGYAPGKQDLCHTGGL